MTLGKRIQKFIKTESAGGIVLLVVLTIALLAANSQFYPYYQQLIEMPIQIKIGHFNLEKSALLWVNEFLMSIFFLLLALEIKREILEGELASGSQLALPVIGAIGGVAAPALIYLSITHGDPHMVQGWPIPTLTDIAFTLGVLSLMSKRVPLNLKVFVVALSIVDDILAIGIIAIFYTGTLSLTALLLAIAGLLTLILLNRLGVKRIAPYMLIGLLIWVCVLESKIHATIAGVVIGLVIPLSAKTEKKYSPLRRLELMLHPWVAFFILPMFVMFNGGVIFTDFSFESILSPVPLGIALGLFLGKSLGIFSIVWVVIQLGIAKLPGGSSWKQLFGVASLTGIGFTMSLFISALAFNNTPFENLARQGVLIGLLLSALLGITVLKFCKPAPHQRYINTD